MPSPTALRRVRIFLSSPRDVAEERRLARELIEGVLRKDPVFSERLLIECVAWDDPEAPTPMLATKAPQASVNETKPSPSQCDIVVVVVWSRIGSPFELEGRRWASGTVWEYENAAEAPSKPDILVYRRTGPLPPDGFDFRHPDFDENRAQYRALENFLSSDLLAGQRIAATLRVELGDRVVDGAVEVLRASEGLVGQVVPLQVAP